MPQATSFWKSLQKLDDFVNVSMQMDIGNGKRTRFWLDNWKGNILRWEYGVLFTFVRDINISVADSWKNNNWVLYLKEPLSQQALQQKESLIRALPQMIFTPPNDQPIWRWDTTSRYSVKSCYTAIKEGPFIASNIEIIWKLNIPTRVTIFIWLLLQDRLLTYDNLIKRGWCIPNMCYMCRSSIENATHLFSKCTYIAEVRGILTVINAATMTITSEFRQGQYANTILKGGSKQLNKLQITLCFVIWRERCARIFRQQSKNQQQLAMEVMQEFKSWVT
jgi:zinc-binding in reverse transcriptase